MAREVCGETGEVFSSGMVVSFLNAFGLIHSGRAWRTGIRCFCGRQTRRTEFRLTVRVCLLQKFVAALAVENLVIIAHDLEVFGPGRLRVGLLLGLGYELVLLCFHGESNLMGWCTAEYMRPWERRERLKE